MRDGVDGMHLVQGADLPEPVSEDPDDDKFLDRPD